MAEKDFIKENIVGRRNDWKKTVRHYARVGISALMFGVVSAASFVAAEPVISGYLHKKEPEEVVLVTEPETTAEETTQAVSQAPAETQAAVPETEAVRSMVEDAMKDVMQKELANHEYTIKDYEKLNQNLKDIAADAEKSMVEVRTSRKTTDFLGQEIDSGTTYPGMIIAHTADEILILTSAEVGNAENDLSVSMHRDSSYAAKVKGVDETDGIAVVSVSTMDLKKKDSTVPTIAIGNSGMLQRGDLLIAVGAPAGTMYSTSEGFVSYVSYNAVSVDGTMEVTMAGIPVVKDSKAFLLNTQGELVGWTTSRQDAKLGEAPNGYCRMASISDYLPEIENLSNGIAFPYLGLRAQEVTLEMEKHGLPLGLYVHECVKDSPAYNAGVQSGDVVVQLNDSAIHNMSDYREALSKRKPDDKVDLICKRRRGAEYVDVKFSLTVGSR